MQKNLTSDKCAPDELEGYIGCQNLIERVRVAAAASQFQNNAMPAMFFYGPPGTGKTTLAKLVGKMRGAKVIVLHGSRVTHKDLDYLFRAYETGSEDDSSQIGMDGEFEYDEQSNQFKLGPTGEYRPTTVVVFDECEKIHKSVFQSLYSTIPSSNEPAYYYTKLAGEPAKCYVPAWTPIFITNHPEQAIKAAPGLFDMGGRCSIQHCFDRYSTPEVYQIISQFADRNDISIDNDAIQSLAEKAHGTPRQALQLFNTAYSYLCYLMTDPDYSNQTIDSKIVHKALELDGIDGAGLSNIERQYLMVLFKERSNTMSLPSMVAKMGIPKETIEKVIEPKLIRSDMIRVTGAGRTISSKGKSHIVASEGGKIMPTLRV